MPLEFAPEPTGSRSALESGLQALNLSPTPTAMAHIAAIGGAQSPPPLPIYTMTLDSAAASKVVDTDKPVAWCYLLVSGNQPSRSAEVLPQNLDNPTAGFAFSSISSGAATAISQAIATAEASHLIAKGKYQMRLIQVPSLYVKALWLKSLDGSGDFYIPIPPIPEGITASGVISANEFLRQIGQLAKVRIGLMKLHPTGSLTN